MAFKIAIGPSSFAAKNDTPIQMLKDAGMTIVPNPYGRRLTENEIIAHLDGVDGLIAGLEPLNRNVIASAKQLKAIARVGIGVDNVDFDAAADHNVKVSNTPDGPTRSVAELTVTCMLTLSRQLLTMNKDLHEGEWKKSISTGLLGTPVLFIGFGRIGKAVSGLLKPFAPQILVYDPFIPEEEKIEGAERVTLAQGLKQAQIITIHASGKKTILGDTEFDQMRTGTFLLNSARAELIDEKAIVRSLKENKVAGAWFDAFWDEPYNGELTTFPNVLLTPHVGTYTEQCRSSMETNAVTNLLRDLGVD